MRLYRTIGGLELRALLNEGAIQGTYNCKTEGQNSVELDNVCCFYVDEFMWRDKDHKFLVVVDMPEEYVTFGIGTYFASKSTKDTKIWTGRTGSEIYKIREAYVHSYSWKEIKEIYLFGTFANWYVEEAIKPVCNKNNVTLHYNDNVSPFSNQTVFKRVKCFYQTMDDLDSWVKKVSINGDKIIEKCKNIFNETKLTEEQAKKILLILAN